MSIFTLSCLRYLSSVVLKAVRVLLLRFPSSSFDIFKKRFPLYGFRDLPVPKKYTYTPLESTNHIRVVELLPSRFEDDKICCRMHGISLATSGNLYSAISYVWGDDTDKITVEVSCDGLLARISPNLHSILLRLRNSSTSKFLWADALCIAQTAGPQGLSEKEQQVRMMDRIFSQAEQVIIDLGSAPAPEVLSCLTGSTIYHGTVGKEQ